MCCALLHLILCNVASLKVKIMYNQNCRILRAANELSARLLSINQSIRVGKNHDFLNLKKSDFFSFKSDFFDLNQISLI